MALMSVRLGSRAGGLSVRAGASGDAHGLDKRMLSPRQERYSHHLGALNVPDEARDCTQGELGGGLRRRGRVGIAFTSGVKTLPMNVAGRHCGLGRNNRRFRNGFGKCDMKSRPWRRM